MTFFPTLRQHYYLLIALTRKEYTAHYKRTLLGLSWSLVNPLIQLAIIMLVFSQFFHQPFLALYLAPGLLVWQFVSQSLTNATYSLANAKDILKKTPLPYYLVPAASVAAAAFNLIILFLAGAVIWIFLHPSAIFFLILALVSLVLLIIFINCLAIITGTLYLKYRDIGPLTHSITLIWFYATPIIWQSSFLPPRFHIILWLNPLHHALELIRHIFTTSSTTTILPSLGILVTSNLAGYILARIIYTTQIKQGLDYV